MPYDPGSYSPGDPWTTKEHISRALTAPRITVMEAAVGDSTPASYFECRALCTGHSNDRYVDVSVSPNTEGAACVVALRRSYDEGDTWETEAVYDTTGLQTTVVYNRAYMLSLKVVSATGTVRLRLAQDL